VTSRDEDQQLRSIFRALGVVDEWESLTGGSVLSGKWRIKPGSDLAEDDQQAHPYEASHAAWAALSAGVSHLACLRDSLFAQTGAASFQARLHTHGQFTLVRGRWKTPAVRSGCWSLMTAKYGYCGGFSKSGQRRASLMK
jgi:hypothetical protein